MTSKQEVFNKLLEMYKDDEHTIIWEYSTNISEDLDKLEVNIKNLAQEYEEAE